MLDSVDKGAKLRRVDFHNIADFVGKPAAGLVAVINGREHRAKEQEHAVRILMIRTHCLRDEVSRIATDHGHQASAYEPKTVDSIHCEVDLRGSHVVKREGFVEES